MYYSINIHLVNEILVAGVSWTVVRTNLVVIGKRVKLWVNVTVLTQQHQNAIGSKRAR